MSEEMTHTQDIDQAFAATIAELKAKDSPDVDVQDAKEEPLEAAQEEHEEEEEEPQIAEEDSEGEEATEEPNSSEDVQELEEDDILPPQSWGAKWHDQWSALPREAKEIVKQRELELTSLVHKKASELENLKKPLQQAMQHVEPYVKEWATEPTPISREQGVIRAVEFYEYIKGADKLELARQFLDASGKTVDDLATPSDPVSNEIKALREEIQHLKSSSQPQHTSAPSPLAAEFEAFRTTLNASGTKRYPQADNAEFAGRMGARAKELMEAIPGLTAREYLQRAYTDIGGRIETVGARTPKTKTIDKSQLDTGYGKGQKKKSSAKPMDSDAAWLATFEEFGLME